MTYANISREILSFWHILGGYGPIKTIKGSPKAAFNCSCRAYANSIVHARMRVIRVRRPVLPELRFGVQEHL